MAGLNPRESQQLRAIAWLRWRLFLNTFRRKGGKGEAIASLLLAVFFAVFGLGPIAAAGIGGFFIVSRAEYHYLSLLLWIVFFVWTTFTISTRAAAPTFDLAQLIRFPLRFRTFLLTRFLFGLLDVPTAVCSFALLAAAIGAGIARVALFPAAALCFFLYDLTLLLFFRMVFLWLDRWFIQRKAREILMGVFFVAMLGFQYLNLTFNSGAERHHRAPRDPIAAARHQQRMNRLTHQLELAEPILRNLPPGLAASSLTHFAEVQPAAAILPLSGLCLYGAAFLTFFARRLRGEFQGENFNEAPARPESRPSASAQEAILSAQGPAPSPIRACLRKELQYLKRSGPLLFPLVTPIFMVFLFVTRAGVMQRRPDWLLPGAIAYILLGLTASMYNVLGTDGAGVQLYFFAPVRLRDVILAKNLMSVLILTAETAIGSAIVLSTNPAPPLPTLCAVYVWVVFVIAVSLTIGNIRSVYSPRLVNFGKMRQGRQGQINALLGMAVLILCLALGAAVLYVAQHVHQPWLAAPTLGIFAAAAIVFYRNNLNHLEAIALERRETISAELCRT